MTGVVVTGLGIASALGTGVDAHRDALWAGHDGVRTIDRFDTRRMTARLGATWPGWDGRVQPEADRDLASTAADFPLHELAIVAAREAWEDSRLEGVDRRRVALVFGTCFGQGFDEFHPVAARIAASLELCGPVITVSTACASSTNAIGIGRDLLRSGRADVVVAGGADQLLREAFAGFSALGVLSAEKCAPFSDPPGTTLGEGAGFVVLERAADAERRGARAWASVHGYGLSADGYHETTPDPSGTGVERAIRSALADAGWDARDIDFVSAHATGTANNDRVEWSVIERELVGRGARLRVGGSKSQIGHTQGAAGAMELILAFICHRKGAVPPTLSFRGARPGCDAAPVTGPRPEEHSVSHALKLSAAFGGANAVLAYAAPNVASRPLRASRSRVVVRGIGAIHPDDALDLGRIGMDPRRLDRSARWLTAAAARALGEGGRPLRGDACARTGLFVGATRMPEESSRRCHAGIRQHGVNGASAAAFARMSVNAPSGACARALALLGPTTTVSIGAGSALLAVVLAAEWLSLRDDVDRIVAGGVDEGDGSPEGAAEGAMGMVLERSADPSGIIVAGWGVAGAADEREAVRQALDGRPPAESVLVDNSRSGVATAVALERLRAGATASIVLMATQGTSNVTLLLERTAP